MDPAASNLCESTGKQNASVLHPPTECCQCTVESTGELIHRKGFDRTSTAVDANK